jgi:4-azaleucine resistance transporter AzlC
MILKSKAFRAAVVDTLPVMTGYLFLGFGFGILMYQSGYGLLWSAAMSIFIYAGSLQYVTVSLLAEGAGLLTVALTSLVVNARHLFYGISMVDAYRDSGKHKPYLIFALTDETYSLVCGGRVPEGVCPRKYRLYVSVLDHLYWIGGTLLGALAGAVLPINFTGIEFVLTALFVTIFVEQWLSVKDHRPALIGAGSTLVCLILFGKDVFLIPSMVIIAATLPLLQKTGGRDSHA